MDAAPCHLQAAFLCHLLKGAADGFSGAADGPGQLFLGEGQIDGLLSGRFVNEESGNPLFQREEEDSLHSGDHPGKMFGGQPVNIVFHIDIIQHQRGKDPGGDQEGFAVGLCIDLHIEGDGGDQAGGG